MVNQNFKLRPLTLDDASKFVATHKAISAHTGTNRSYKPELIQSQWQEPTFDLEKSSCGIFTDDDHLVGYVVIWDNSEIPVHPWIEWGVHPDYHKYDLGTQLLQWADKTTQRIIDLCPSNARLSLHTGANKGYAPMEETLQKAGYTAIRSSYEMRIDMETRPTLPDLPAGFKIRTYNVDKDLVAFIHAFRDSFSDHFGYVEEPLDKDIEEFTHRFATDTLFDPELFFLTIDENTDNIAGFVLGLKEEHGDPTVGYIDLVGVTPAYRRRGLAKTLLTHTFLEYWNRHKKSVTLGVDGDSLTNAVQLYERVGMHIYHQYVRYEKVIREGQELATIAVE